MVVKDQNWNPCRTPSRRSVHARHVASLQHQGPQNILVAAQCSCCGCLQLQSLCTLVETSSIQSLVADVSLSLSLGLFFLMEYGIGGRLWMCFIQYDGDRRCHQISAVMDVIHVQLGSLKSWVRGWGIRKRMSVGRPSGGSDGGHSDWHWFFKIANISATLPPTETVRIPKEITRSPVYNGGNVTRLGRQIGTKKTKMI